MLSAILQDVKYVPNYVSTRNYSRKRRCRLAISNHHGQQKTVSQKCTSVISYKPLFPLTKKCGHLVRRTSSAVALLIGWATMFFATQVLEDVSDFPHSPYHEQYCLSAETKTQHSARRRPNASGPFILQPYSRKRSCDLSPRRTFRNHATPYLGRAADVSR